MELKFNKRDPVYVQVVRYLKTQIATGMLVAGQEIPSRRELASQLKINPNTAQRAYKEMEEEGLIHTERNYPSRITEDMFVIKTVREELIFSAVDSFIQAIEPLHMDMDELVDIVKERYKQI